MHGAASPRKLGARRLGAPLLAALAAEEVALALLERRELGGLRLEDAAAHFRAALGERTRLHGSDVLDRRGEHEGDEHAARDGVHLDGNLKGCCGGAGGGLELLSVRMRMRMNGARTGALGQLKSSMRSSIQLRSSHGMRGNV